MECPRCRSVCNDKAVRCPHCFTNITHPPFLRMELIIRDGTVLLGFAALWIIVYLRNHYVFIKYGIHFLLTIRACPHCGYQSHLSFPHQIYSYTLLFPILIGFLPSVQQEPTNIKSKSEQAFRAFSSSIFQLLTKLTSFSNTKKY